MRIFILLLFLPFAGLAQSVDFFHIIKVNGDIFHISKNKSLSTGDKLNGGDHIKFGSTEASAQAISNDGVRYNMVRPDIEVYDENAGISVMMTTSPVVSRGQLSTRGFIAIEESIKDLKSHFGNSSFAVLGDSISLKLDKGIYPLNNDKFIVFYYKINGVQVAKKVGFNKQHLNIEKDKLFESKGNYLKGKTIEKLEVYQYEESTNTSNLITKIDLHFVDTETLKQEFDVMLPIIAESSDLTEKRNYLIDYFDDTYGLTDYTSLSEFVDEYLASK